MRRRIALVLAAVLLALTGAVLVAVGAGDSGAEAASEEEAPQTAPALVATQLIPAGTTGQELADQALVELRDMPIAAVPPGVVADVVPLREFVANGDIQPGEMLLQAKFVTRSQAGSVKIPDDKVAMSVEVAAPQRVGNFVQPGTDVAVFATYTVETPTSEPLPPGATEWPAGTARPVVDAATRLMLPRATVLAVNDTTAQGLAAAEPTGEGQAQESKAVVVTLAVTVEEAQKLAHATQTDRLTLALLSDKSRTGTSTADDNRTLFN